MCLFAFILIPSFDSSFSLGHHCDVPSMYLFVYMFFQNAVMYLRNHVLSCMNWYYMLLCFFQFWAHIYLSHLHVAIHVPLIGSMSECMNVWVSFGGSSAGRKFRWKGQKKQRPEKVIRAWGNRWLACVWLTHVRSGGKTEEGEGSGIEGQGLWWRTNNQEMW